MDNLPESNLQAGKMTAETEHLNIYKKMFEVMKAINGVKKEGSNDYHNYDYIKEEDVVKKMKMQLVEHNINYNSTVIAEKSEGNYRKVLVRFILTDLDSGEQFISQYWGEGMDKGDKGYYKAYAGATKYFFMKNFLLASGNDPEADATTDKHAYGNNNKSTNNSRSNTSRSKRNSTRTSSSRNKSTSSSSNNNNNEELASKLKVKISDNEKLQNIANDFLKMLSEDKLTDLSNGELKALNNKMEQVM